MNCIQIKLKYKYSNKQDSWLRLPSCTRHRCAVSVFTLSSGATISWLPRHAFKDHKQCTLNGSCSPEIPLWKCYYWTQLIYGLYLVLWEGHSQCGCRRTSNFQTSSCINDLNYKRNDMRRLWNDSSPDPVFIYILEWIWCWMLYKWHLSLSFSHCL